MRRNNLTLVGVDQGGAPVAYCVTTPPVDAIMRTLVENHAAIALYET